MKVKLDAMEEALVDVERLRDATKSHLVLRRKVAERTVRQVREWLSLGMFVPAGQYPKLSEFQHRIAAESDELFVKRHRQ